MDIGDCLRRLGLEQYEAAFRDNNIDETILPSLTTEDLKELGIGSIGHRRKLLDTIAALQAEASEPAARSDAALETDKPVRDTAERRQVTVMFADLVGSTALSARMDPEDLREIISAYQKCVADIARRFGGFVAKYMGDGVLVYFGYPAAHEDDAERAVRAGLDVVGMIAQLKTCAREPLKVRVGIATGLVVVGDLIGSGEAQERGILGETPNLAARLQAIAEPDTVVIAEATRRLLGNLFELRDLGPKELKGIDGPVRAFAALRPSSVESRFEAMHAGGLTALVGREEELELLLRRWARAKTGEGQVVLLSGEAGIGKSRLSAALMEGLAAEPHTRLRYFCSPQHTDSAFYPIIGQLERAAGLAHDDPPQTKLDKLDRLLAQTSTSQRDAALLAEMLSLPNDGRYPALELDPEQRRQKTLEALGAQLETLGRASPVLMVLEDAHWADPTSLEAFGRTVSLVRTLRVLLVVTFRLEFDAPWVGQPHVTVLTINRLAEREIGAIIDRVIGKNHLPTNIRKDIIERTDGIPLFVEEMTKAVLEAGGELEAIQTAAAVASPALGIPASLHASLMARLDRLGPAKELAQIGAAIGREFSHALLTAVVRKPEAELGTSLDRLVAAGLLFRQGVPPHATYLFKHALVQDAAYGTLLREPRHALHARIARTLETEFSELVDNQPELLARHYTEAGQTEKASSLWGKAGYRLLARSALVEAAAHLIRALDQLASLPATPTLRREQIKLQVALMNATFFIKGYSAAETREAIERARLLIEQTEALGEPLEDPLILFSVLYGDCAARFMAGNGHACRDLATEFMALGEKQGATIPTMIGHRLMGQASLLNGRVAEARACYDNTIALYDPREHRALTTRFGLDQGATALSYRSLALWMLGYPAAAVGDLKQAVAYARECGHVATLSSALLIGGVVMIFLCDHAGAKLLADEASILAKEKRGVPITPVLATLLSASLLAVTGKPLDAVNVFASAIPAWRAMGHRTFLPMMFSHLGFAYAQLGNLADAWRSITDALAEIDNGEKWYESETLRMAGELALLDPTTDEIKAQSYFERAIAVAQKRQTKAWELRASMSMARLWRDQGKRDQARELLAPVYGWFTEGLDTSDLKQARALLDELAQ